MAEVEPAIETENTIDSVKEEDEDEENVENTEELTEDAQALKEELAKIVVHAPTVDLLVFCNLFSRLKNVNKSLLTTWMSVPFTSFS